VSAYFDVTIPKLSARSSHQCRVSVDPNGLGGIEQTYASIVPRAYLVVAGKCEGYPLLAAVSKTSARCTTHVDAPPEDEIIVT